MLPFVKKNFDQPDETMTPPKMKKDIVKFGGFSVERVTFQPGWKFSTDMGQIMKTPLHEGGHVAYQLSGKIHVVNRDGTEVEVGPGDLQIAPPGHDAWVVGDEPAVMLDFIGLMAPEKK